MIDLIVIAIILILLKIVLSKTKKYNWLRSLKPGDVVLVRVYSKMCECLKEATVTKSLENNFLEAKIIDHKKCEQCAILNSKETENGAVTCWYNVNRFHKNNVVKNHE